MAKANRVLIRLSMNDVILTQDELEKLNSSDLTIYDKDNKAIFEMETYVVGYEDEEGNECHEDGEYFN